MTAIDCCSHANHLSSNTQHNHRSGMLPTALLVLATVGCLCLGTYGIPLHPAPEDDSHATSLANEIRAQLRQEVEGMVSEAVERATRSLKEENLILRSQLISSQKQGVSRRRRTINGEQLPWAREAAPRQSFSLQAFSSPTPFFYHF